MEDVIHRLTKNCRGLLDSAILWRGSLVRYSQKTWRWSKRWLTSKLASAKARLTGSKPNDPTLF